MILFIRENPMTHPLEDPKNWGQEKKWIVPLEFTAKVDDAAQYDEAMKKVLGEILSELRAIVRNNFDKGKGMFFVSFGEPIKDIKKFNEAVKSVESNETIKSLNIQEMIQAEIAKVLGKK
jgi:hypothetical protein